MSRCIKSGELIDKVGLMSEYDYQGKLKLLREGVVCHPNNATIWRMFIKNLTYSGMIREALAVLKKFEAQFANTTEEADREILARTFDTVANWIWYESKNKHTKADYELNATLYEKAYRLKPNYLYASYAAGGFGYEGARQYTKAIAIYEDAKSLFENKGQMSKWHLEIALNAFYAKDYQLCIDHMINYPFIHKHAHQSAIKAYLISYFEGTKTGKIISVTQEQKDTFSNLLKEYITVWPTDSEIQIIKKYSENSQMVQLAPKNDAVKIINEGSKELDMLKKENLELKKKLDGCNCNLISKDGSHIQNTAMEAAIPLDWGV